MLADDIDEKKDMIEDLQLKLFKITREKDELKNMWNHEVEKAFIDNVNLK